MRRKELADLIYDMIVNTIGITETVIFQDENGPRVEMPFLTIRVSNSTLVGSAYYDKSDASGNQNIKTERDFVVSIQSYGATEAIEQITEQFDTQKVYDFMQLNCLAFRTTPIINDISQLFENTIEKRYSLDVTIGTGTSIIDTPGFINKIDGSGKVDNIDIDY